MYKYGNLGCVSHVLNCIAYGHLKLSRMTTGFFQLWQIFQISCFGKLASHNAKMFPDIIFLRSQGKNLLMIKNEDEIENLKKITSRQV